ncbi:Gfo/Idh/MocA family oxidoreductase [Treponema sp.]|uniref:Gfo/Idh/MocA family protein n=1 Tax=Treponema sp. TaxID=166 RepID=UPI00298DDDC6|nr:Gfo/Idh/MocA family oxidoreductase [Treponema sp.]MCR5612850.1 Gfo/Idh/MocA family oxidoreductase [Treponema sp.]
MKQLYTACVIGTGRIGFTLGFDKKREQPASHTMALLANNRIKIIAGVDTDSAKLTEWKNYVDAHQFPHSLINSNKVKTFATVEDLFNNCSPDIVTIAVNEDAHLSTALCVIEHKPRLVILEKPVALSSVQGMQIVRHSKKYGVPVLVNHERRFALDYSMARDYMTKIGDIQKISASLFSGMRLYDPKAENSGGYSLLHDGTHLVDVVLYLLGAVDKEKLSKPVITGLCRDAKEKKVVRSFTASYATKAVPDVEIMMSGRSRFFGFEVDVLGTTGRIKIGNGFAEFYQRRQSRLYTGFYSLEKDSLIKVPKKTGYFSNMIKNAVDFLDGNSELKSTLQTGMNALSVLEEMKELIK